jgi:thioredoxin-related protein
MSLETAARPTQSASGWSANLLDSVLQDLSGDLKAVTEHVQAQYTVADRIPGQLPADRTLQSTDNTGHEIAWRTNVLDAYHEARDSEKPMIVLFSDDSCGHCRRLQIETLKDTRIQALANRAVFLIATPEKDPQAATMADALNVTGYPTVSVLDARPDAIDEIGRVVGYMAADDFYKQLIKFLPASEDTVAQNEANSQENSCFVLDCGSVESLYGKAAKTSQQHTMAA